MSRKSKIFIALIVLVIAVLVALNVTVFMSGKRFVEHKLGELFGVKASIDSVSLSIPLTINIRGLEIGKLLKAESISLRPSILSLFAGRIVLSSLRIVNPVVNIEMNTQGLLNLPGKSAGAGTKKGEGIPFFLTALNIKNGKFIFTDKKIMPQGYKTIIDRINIDISKTMLPPTSLNTKFGLEAEVVDAEGGKLGAIYGSGRIDFGPKDMDATLGIKEIELTYFAPYYGNFLSNRKLVSAKLTTVSEFKAKNNVLKIATQLKLHDLVYAQETFEKINPSSIFELAQKALDFFLDPGGNLNLQFTLDTKLDKPRIAIADLKKVILEAAIQGLSSQSPVELFRKGKELIEQFKEFGNGVEDLF